MSWAVWVVLAFALFSTGIARADDWIGDRYGWRQRGGLDATVDGHHWKTIICCLGLVQQFAHTGPTAGMVSLGDEQFPPFEVFGTVDNGKHWYEYDLAATRETVMGGHGRYLFWQEQTQRGMALYQVLPWPPTGAALRCKGRFKPDEAASAGLFCYEPAHQPRLTRVSPVLTGTLGGIDVVSVPGGVAALAIRENRSDRATPLLRLVIRRYETTYVIPLPTIAPELEAESAFPTLTVSWPFIQVATASRGKVIAVWTSRDGARTWDVWTRS